jgi:histidinol dehydrogenase
LGVEDFIKRINLMVFTQSALKRFEKDVKRFAEWEGLEGHYQSVQRRMAPERRSIQGGEKR